ncbi:MAG: LytTR family transcriptional regulator [Deltaproteobacteria bacterium]|nr:LytTR family transcriptional regulator [Deltaproteobacteria bacterium]
MAVTTGKVLIQNPDYLKAHLGSYFTHALHFSLSFLIGVILAELAVRLICPGWSAYQRRTVARQWLIWGLGFGLGLSLYRVSGPLLIPIYAPWVITLLKYVPHAKPADWQIVLFCAAVWAVATFAVIQSALCWQRQLRRKEEASSRHLAAQNPDPAPVAETPPRPAPVAAQTQAPTPAPAAEAPSRPVPALLSVSHDGQQSTIPVNSITHVTVEDHYCRIHVLDGKGPSSVFVCMSLKSLAEELPEGDFAQIHRSHLVNLRHVAGLNKSGRQYFAELPQAGAELPISRHRWAELQERLPEAKSAK